MKRMAEICFISDINECLPNGGLGFCAQNCTNTVGSFDCSCKKGFSQSGYSCFGKDYVASAPIWP